MPVRPARHAHHGRPRRPLARDAVSFAQLYETRRESYARADYRIPIESDDPAVAVEATLRLPLFK